MTEPPAEVGQTTPEGQATPETPEGYVPQKDVSKIAANEKREGKKSAHSEILERTGLESLDDVFSIVEAHQLTQAEMETAADREERAKKKAEGERDSWREQYYNTHREFALRDALRDAGINSERLAFVMRGADLTALEVDKDGNVSGLEGVVEAAQKEAPEFFGDQPRPRVNAPQTSGTSVEQTQVANDDPKVRMGQSLLGWLTDPIPEDEKNQQGTWP